jgi:hypothetical protein
MAGLGVRTLRRFSMFALTGEDVGVGYVTSKVCRVMRQPWIRQRSTVDLESPFEVVV